MAPSSQSTLLAGPVTLTLFKLSFSTTAALKANILWTHLPNRDDLFAVFDSAYHRDLEGSITEKKFLKLIRGGDLLETLELDTLVSQARLDEERSKSQHLQDGDRHVILMVKKPLLAVRYQLPTGQIRRFQMNFRPESGFDFAYHAFQALGLPIRDRSQPQSLSLARMPNASILPLNTAQQQTPTGLLPSPEFNFRPTTSTGYVNRPLGPSIYAPETPSERPSTAPMTFSQMLPPLRELPLAIKPPRPPDRESSQGDQNASQPASSQSQVSAKAKPKRKARVKTPKAVASDSQMGDMNPTLAPKDQPATTKQKTEPKKRKAGAPTTKSKPKPSAVEKGSVDGTPNQEPFSMKSQLLHPGVLSSDPLSRTLHMNTTDETRSHLGATEKRASSPLVLRVGSKALAEISAKEANRCWKQAAPAQSQDNDVAAKFALAGDISPEDFMTRLDGWVRKYQHLPAPTSHPPPVSDLADYAARPEEERLAILDDMICECLEDANFTKLVGDVEKSWKRIGLGF